MSPHFDMHRFGGNRSIMSVVKAQMCTSDID